MQEVQLRHAANVRVHARDPQPSILYSSLESASVTIFVRTALGTRLSRFRPVNVQCIRMTFGSGTPALILADRSFTLILSSGAPCASPSSCASRSALV